MNIKVLMITFNRPKYTELSLKRLCDTAPPNLSLTVWDNGSDRPTKEIVERFKNHPSIECIVFNKRNDKLRKPTNWFWKNNLGADLIGKVDDDCLVPKDWCSILEQTHRDIPEAGMLGCWHFFPEDVVSEIALKKTYTFGRHKIMRNCWIGGSGYLMKKKVLERNGYLKRNESFTDFCLRAAAKGFINGWYYPFLYQEHMDDPRAENTDIKTDEDFRRLIPLSARAFNIQTRDEWIQRLKTSAIRLQEYSINPNDFIGIKPKIKRKIFELFGREYFPRFAKSV